jgi:hypothetical protein
MANSFFNASIIYDGFDDLLAAVGALPSAVAPDIAASLYSTWYGLASRRLRSSRVRYLAALQPPKSVRGGAAYEITLEGAFPVMVEEGADSYDVGKAILKGQSYQRVPFKQTGANAGFGAKSTPMGYGYRAKARGKPPVSPELAYPSGARREAAKAHKAYGSSKGMRDPWRVLGQSGITRTTAMNLGKLRPHHSRPIYAGQVPDTGRKVASDGVDTFLHQRGAGGVTFRTVNEDSNWIHPGIRARRLSIVAAQRFQSKAGVIISRHVERL